MAWQQALDPSNWKIDWWTAFGLMGNLAFSCRFLVQWIASERAGRTVVPMAFWYLSILGGVIMLTYSIFGRQDLVVMLGYIFNLVPYMRNVVLTRRHERKQQAGGPESSEQGEGAVEKSPTGAEPAALAPSHENRPAALESGV